MKLLSYNEFGDLRLSEFLPHEQLWENDNWEFMDCVWLGEMCGFTGFLRLMAEPRVVRAICLYFSEIPDTVTHAVLSRIGLPLSPAMAPEETLSIIGAPVKTVHFTSDRTSHQFLVGTDQRYDVHCGFHESEGLVGVDILRSDYKKWRVRSG